MASARTDKYWTRIKISIAVPLALFLLYMFAYLMQVPTGIEDAEITFGTYPAVNTILWLFILSPLFAVVLFWHSLYRDKQELSKDFPDVKQRHWITIAVFSYFTAGLYPASYLFFRYMRIKTGVQLWSTDEPSDGADSRREDIEVKKGNQETRPQQSQKEVRAEIEQSEQRDQKESNQQESEYLDQQQERRQEVQERVKSIRSDLKTVDSLITDAEFRQAKQLVDKIESRIVSVKREASQKRFEEIKTEVKRLEQKRDGKLTKSHILRQLRNMDPYEFEKLVAKIWRKQGWDAKPTSGSTDRGVDVVATKEDAFEKRRHLIQVKRHGENTTVGSGDIQRYASLYQRDEQVDNVFIVTSNRFTSEAKEVAKRRDVSIVNGDELYEMLTET
jgi:HJR/Mrr/RecB family endonuclease